MIIYRTNGIVNTVNLNGRKATLKQLQEAVGGYIEPVPGGKGLVFCNEDGRAQGLQFNKAASVRFEQGLVGDVVELSKEEAE